MTEADLNQILAACKPVPMIMLQCGGDRSPQENANRAWAELGERMGFDHMTVQPIAGKGNRFFTAVPRENETQRAERIASERAEERARKIDELTHEIVTKQEELSALLGEGAAAGAD